MTGVTRHLGDEVVDVPNGGLDARTEAARAGRAAVAAGIPGVEGEVVEAELVHDVGHSTRVLMPSMKEDDRSSGPLQRRGPVTVEELRSVGRAEGAFSDFSQETSGPAVGWTAACNERNSRRPHRIRFPTVTAPASANAHMTHDA